VELVVHGPRPAFLAVPSASVDLVDAVLLEPILPRRWPAASAPTGCSGHAADRPAGEPQPDGAVTGGAHASRAAGQHDQLPRPRHPARTEAGH
jgi:hypothetical protein